MAPPAFIQAMRLPFLTGSLTPVVVTAAWTGQSEAFTWANFGLTLLGVGALQTGANLINDYFDSKGSDAINRYFTPFSGGSRAIQEGGMSPVLVLFMSLAAFALALACGLVLVFDGRPWVLLVGGLGLAGGVLYSARPWQLMSRGLGEAVIFLLFGPLLTLGAGYVFTDGFTARAFWLGLPQAWLITAVLWINQFPDLEADTAAGKHNLVVRTGTGFSRWVYLFFMLAPFPSLVLLSEWLGFSWWVQLAWLALPLSIRAVIICLRRHLDPRAVVPAQALTIQTHLAVGLLMALGLLIASWL